MINVFSWREAIQRSSLQPTTRHILLNLSLYMNERGRSCFPSLETQVADTGLSKRCIGEHIEKAVEAGFLVKSKHGYAGKQWARNEYAAVFPAEFGALRAADIEAEEGGDGASLPDDEGGDSNSTKVVTQGHSKSSSNSPKEKIYKKKPRKLITLAEWEAEKGSPLRVEMVARWMKEKRLCPILMAEMVDEFRDRMHAGGNQYADFADALKVYVRSGYLSKKMPQLLASASPHTGKAYKEQVVDTGGRI